MTNEEIEKIDEMIELLEAYKRGEEIQYLNRLAGMNDPIWQGCADPNWNFAAVRYRIAPRKPSINWDHVSDKINWIAVNINKKGFGYNKKPVCGQVSWHTICRFWYGLEPFSSFDPGNCDWKDSLVKRPGYEGE